MEVYGHSIHDTGHIVSSLGYIAHGFESTGTWFRRYWGTGYGYIVSHYRPRSHPVTRPLVFTEFLT